MSLLKFLEATVGNIVRRGLSVILHIFISLNHNLLTFFVIFCYYFLWYDIVLLFLQKISIFDVKKDKLIFSHTILHLISSLVLAFCIVSSTHLTVCFFSFENN